jgi:hypothetical protein
VGSVHERLREAGIRLDARDLRPQIRSEATRVARILVQKQCRLVGLAPAADDVAVPAVALQLGLALVEVTGSPVGVLDAHGSWPGARTLAVPGKPGTQDTSLFSAHWLVDNLAFLAPRSFDTGAVLMKLGAALAAEAQVFHHLVVDMTGLDHLGDHLSAIDLLDGVIVVARAGRTTVPELHRWMRDVPEERNLGVLLVGA